MSDLISFDYAIKYLLKDKGDYEIVEGFISALLASEGYKPIKIKALLESESNKESKHLKRSIADVIVEDEQGCQAEKSFEITSPDVLQTKETIVDNVCNGDSNGSITTQAFGGMGPYNYSWKKAGVIIGT